MFGLILADFKGGKVQTQQNKKYRIGWAARKYQPDSNFINKKAGWQPCFFLRMK
jgi:hypothetical protein